ncbi:hypothetical protein N657DRAFT_330558 [Parathielavia appendiculata]|uniref:DUF7587 domain-containing protein n=1 Tax=Parathielavia appendiculata TaxID=2587402 RepID=A0AAN6U1M2_9PEZI|nr:hypothetical protein N657DRAFT_330558 [Parathielavia appendiculata]
MGEPLARRVNVLEEVRDALLFSPSPAQRSVSKSFNDIPTYLFRVHGPSTVGTTTTRQVSSPACDHGLNKKDLFQLQPWEAARCLEDHFWWNKRHDEKGDCNFMSWSSSLLFVLQYGLYRQSKDRREGRDTCLSQVYLLVLDTRKFPKGTFIKDLDAIEAFHGYDKNLARMKAMRTEYKDKDNSDVYFYYGEYLSQGRLDVSGRCRQTSMQQLIDAGLFNLCPELADPTRRDQWAKPVNTIREKIVHGLALAANKEEVRTAITVAQACFGSLWALPLAVMFLSLRPRKPDGITIFDGFRSMFTGKLCQKQDFHNARCG